MREQEDTRFGRAVADLTLNNQILNAAAVLTLLPRVKLASIRRREQLPPEVARQRAEDDRHGHAYQQASADHLAETCLLGIVSE